MAPPTWLISNFLVRPASSCKTLFCSQETKQKSNLSEKATDTRISNVWAPQDEAGLTRKFEMSHVGGATCRMPPIPGSALEKDPTFPI